MTENSENIRVDSQTREDKQRGVTDWGGRRFIAPKGTTLPAVTDDLIDGEVFVLIRGAGLKPQFYLFDEGLNKWSTVGP